MAKAVTAKNSPNENQNFLPIKSGDDWRLELHPFVASTAIEEGTAVGIEISANTTTGYLTKQGVENAAGADVIGILAEPIVSTDDDYATAGKLKAVWVPRTLTADAEFTVVNGTFTAADVYKTVQIASTSLGLDVDTRGLGARITGYISSTRGKCRFVMPNTETA